MGIKYLNKEIAIWINDFLITRSNSLDFPEENEQFRPVVVVFKDKSSGTNNVKWRSSLTGDFSLRYK